MKNIRRIPIFIIFIFLFSSCIKHVDFEQIEDLTAEPVFKTSLIYFTLDQVAFFDRINSLEIVAPIGKTSDLEPLNNSFIKNNLKELGIDFEIRNEFDRDFTVNVQFLDANDNITHSFNTLTISANNLKYLHNETIVVSGNQQFLSSTKIRAYVQLSPSNNGSTIDPNIEKKLVFKTTGTFSLKIEK